MSTAFNTRRRPDAISKTISMDMHLADDSPNVHSQYMTEAETVALINQYISASGDIDIPITDDIADNSRGKAAAAYITYTINQSLTTHKNDTVAHVTSIERSTWDSKAPGNHTHDIYLKKDDISATGIYPNTKQTSADNNSQYDLNQSPYLTQGMYFINPGNGQSVVNGPNYIAGQTDTSSGFLMVSNTAASTAASTATIMQIFYGDNEIYKRVITKSGNTYTYGSWRLILASQPIGALLFVTGNEIPAGYIEANGGIYSKNVYKLLWEYANRSANTGSLVSLGEYTARNDAGTLDEVKGKYWDVGEQLVGNVLVDSFHVPNLCGEFLKVWDCDTIGGRELGTLEAAGIPNITGTIPGEKFNAANNFWSQVSGAFVKDPTASGVESHGGIYADTDNTNIKFDASRVNTVYRDDVDTVTPENVTIHVCIHAYNGSILPQDTTAATIQDVLRTLLNEYGYATTSATGLVQLATVQEVITGENDQHVITPATLKAAYGVSSIVRVPSTDIYEVTEDTEVDHDKKYFKYVSGNFVTANDYYQSTDTVVDVTKTYYMIDSSTSTYVIVDEPTGNPSTSGYYEYKTVFDGTTTYYERITYGICCTAVNIDIATPSNTFVDIDLSDIVTANMIDQMVLTPMLVCTDASNDLKYPAGAVVNNPVCVIKPNNSNEQLVNVDFVVYNLPSYKLTSDTEVVEDKEYYTRSGEDPEYEYTLVDSPTGSPSTNNYYEVENLAPTLRVYWPLMWYLRAFKNVDATNVSGARLFPMVRGAAGSTPSIDDIKSQLTKWKLQFKLSWQ